MASISRSVHDLILLCIIVKESSKTAKKVRFFINVWGDMSISSEYIWKAISDNTQVHLSPYVDYIIPTRCILIFLLMADYMKSIFPSTCRTYRLLHNKGNEVLHGKRFDSIHIVFNKVSLEI